MKILSDKWYKKAELITAFISFVLIAIYLVISSFSGGVKVFSDAWIVRSLCYAVCSIPFIMLVVMSFVSNKIKSDCRIIPCLLIAMEVVLGFVTDGIVINFRPVGMFEIANIINYNSLNNIILQFAILALLLIPISKKPVMLGYAGLTTLLFIVDLCLELWYGIFVFDGGIKWDTLIWVCAAIAYQLTLLWYSFEINSSNRKHIYSWIFDFFIGWDVFDEYCDDAFDEEEEINE